MGPYGTASRISAILGFVALISPDISLAARKHVPIKPYCEPRIPNLESEYNVEVSVHNDDVARANQLFPLVKARDAANYAQVARIAKELEKAHIVDLLKDIDAGKADARTLQALIETALKTTKPENAGSNATFDPKTSHLETLGKEVTYKYPRVQGPGMPFSVDFGSESIDRSVYTLDLSKPEIRTSGHLVVPPQLTDDQLKARGKMLVVPPLKSFDTFLQEKLEPGCFVNQSGDSNPAYNGKSPGKSSITPPTAGNPTTDSVSGSSDPNKK